MTYNETLDYLYNAMPAYQNQGGSAYKANLNNTYALMEGLGNPHQKFRSIHVAGTNGKGSISHTLAAIFQECGYKTGLYTSPHLLDFRERIRINGQMISQNEVIQFTKNHKALFKKIQPSFFEMTVSLAFQHFAKEKVDIAIIETGLGGRLDSTNIITPEASVITNISLDHTQFLGDTLEQIATEKAGIIKTETPCILGEMPKDLVSIFKQKAIEQNTSIQQSNLIYQFVKQEHINPYNYLTFRKGNKNINIKTDLCGNYQTQNLATILCTVDTINTTSNYSLPNNSVSKALQNVAKSTGLRGRWEILQESPLWIADTGHNEAGIAYLMEQIKQLPHPNKYIIYGCVNDKEIEHIFPLFEKDWHYIFTQSQNKRSKDVQHLYKLGNTFNLNCDYKQTVKKAIAQAQQLATSEDVIIICGSTFVVADALPLFN